jgi:hypothetical protein
VAQVTPRPYPRCVRFGTRCIVSSGLGILTTVAYAPEEDAAEEVKNLKAALAALRKGRRSRQARDNDSVSSESSDSSSSDDDTRGARRRRKRRARDEPSTSEDSDAESASTGSSDGSRRRGKRDRRRKHRGRTIAADLAEAISARTPATVLDRVTGLIAKAHTKAAAGASSRRPFTAPAGKKRTRYFPKGGQRQSAEPPPHLAADADGPGAGADQVISVSTPCSGDKELKNTMCQVMCNGGPQHRERKRQRPGTVNGWKPSTVLTRLSSAQAAGTPRARRVLGAGPGASQSWRSGDAASSHTHIKSTKR